MSDVTMDEQALQRFRAEVIARKNLPTIPAVLARILALVDREDARGKDLVEVIEHDQALTSKMLRLANSAFFGQTRRVATIPRALMLLGFSTVRNLALGVKVWDALSTGVSRAHFEELWAHAVAVAVASRCLASQLRAGDPDEAFTAGLLHDVGRLVLAMRFRDEYWQAAGGADESGPVEIIERDTFGIDHAEVGGWMLEAWSLPPSLVEAVRLHHAADSRPGVTALLALSDRLVAWTDLATGTIRPEAVALLESTGERGLTTAMWQEAVDEIRDGAGLATRGLTEG